MRELREKIRALVEGPYKQYKTLQGEYRLDDFVLSIDHVQGDPFANPSRISIHVSHELAGFPQHLWSTPDRKRACEDYLARMLDKQWRQSGKASRGSGRSGEVGIACNAQEVLRRSCLLFQPDHLEARILVGLPADGRRILADEAETLLCDQLPAVIRSSLFYESIDADENEAHVYSIEDQSELRNSLAQRGLVAFLADGSMLPRHSGIDDRPMAGEIVPLRAPDPLAVELELPNGGRVRGLGIPQGVTVIVGGGFHGKSTLLHAIERGVYDHAPGDGRERVVTVPDAMKVRAEDGRAISMLDISGFIAHLPLGRDTVSFTTENASGSSSQAANIIEALHSGSRLLLIDEDTSATNFMIRDRLMRQLVTDDCEPITPLLYRVRELYDQFGVSSVIVMGGSGDYLSVADTVIMMQDYRVIDVTERARSLGAEVPVAPGDMAPLSLQSTRRPIDGDPGPDRDGRTRINVYDTGELVFGNYRVDTGKLEQLVDPAQLETIGWLLAEYCAHRSEGQPVVEALNGLVQRVEREGFDWIAPYERMGGFAMPRIQELAGVLNRFRDLKWQL